MKCEQNSQLNTQSIKWLQEQDAAADGDEDAYTAVLADGSKAILEHLCVGAKQGAEVQRVTV